MNARTRRDSSNDRVLGTLAVALLGCAVLLSAATGDAAPPGAKATIEIVNFAFKDQTLTVTAGTEVTWVNHDDAPHKVMSADKKFSSPVLDTGARFAHTFATRGTYNYYCSLHPMMTGTVIVK